MLASLIGPPQYKPTEVLEIAVNPHQRQSKVILSDFQKNQEELMWIKLFYKIKFLDITEKSLYHIPVPCYRFNRIEWTKFNDENFKTTGFAFADIRYDLYRYLVDNDYNYNFSRVSPFPRRCEYHILFGKDDIEYDIEQFKNYKYCICRPDGLLVTDYEDNSTAYEVVKNVLVVKWSGQITRGNWKTYEETYNTTRPHLLRKVPYPYNPGIAFDVLEKYWSLHTEFEKIKWNDDEEERSKKLIPPGQFRFIMPAIAPLW